VTGSMTNTNCSKCGKSIKPSDKFCPACGHPVGQKANSGQTGRRDQFIILGILVIVVMLYVGYQAISTKSEPPQKPAPTEKAAAMPVDMEAFTQNLPADFPSLVSMGNALMDQGNYELAIECYRRALELNPKDVNIIVDLGTCQHSLGQNLEAIENFKKALEYAPDHQIAKFNLGIVYYAAGEPDQAVEWWKRLLSENPPQDLKQRTEAFIRQVEDN